MKSSRSRCRAVKQRAVCPRAVTDSRALTICSASSGTVAVWCLFHFKSIAEMSQMSPNSGGIFFPTPAEKHQQAEKLLDEGKKHLAKSISASRRAAVKHSRRATTGTALSSALFLLLISCVIQCCDDRRAGPGPGPGTHAHLFAVYLRDKGHW